MSEFRETPIPVSGQPERCVHCAKEVPVEAACCPSCGKSRMPRWMARALASWWFGLLRWLCAGVVVWAASTEVQKQMSMEEQDRQRAHELSRQTLAIQTLTEELQRPCLLRSAEGCAHRYEGLVTELSTAVYTFKEESRAMFRGAPGGDPSLQSVQFIDEFFNPGWNWTRARAVPLQIQMLRAFPLHTTPYDQSSWCSPENREIQRQLSLSINVYRLCYHEVRDAVLAYGARRESPLASVVRRRAPPPVASPCSSGSGMEDRVAQIVARIESDRTNQYAAPWNTEAFCARGAGVTTPGP